MERMPFEDRVRGVVHMKDRRRRPCVVIAHGFKGFMGWGMFPWIADRLAEAGFTAVRFDFSHNGADANGDFTRLDLFEKNTLTLEQADLAWVVDEFARDRGKLGLLGHSRGGGGVIEYGARDERIGAVATLAAVARTNRFPAEAVAAAERDGSYPVLNGRTGQMMPVGVEYFRDAANHDILAAAAKLGERLLVVHGTDDESVPVDEGRELAAASGGPLVEISGGGHTFGAVHPFQGATPHLDEALDAVVRFFASTLGSG